MLLIVLQWLCAGMICWRGICPVDIEDDIDPSKQALKKMEVLITLTKEEGFYPDIVDT